MGNISKLRVTGVVFQIQFLLLKLGDVHVELLLHLLELLLFLLDHEVSLSDVLVNSRHIVHFLNRLRWLWVIRQLACFGCVATGNLFIKFGTLLTVDGARAIPPDVVLSLFLDQANAL